MHRAVRRTAAALAASVMLAPAVAQAQISVFNTLSGWQSAVSAPGLDTFDDLAVDIGFSIETPLTRSAGVHGYTLSTGPSDFNGVFVGGLPAISDAWLSNGFVGDGMIFNSFSPAVRAIGADFFLTNEFGNFFGTGSVRITVVSGAFTATETVTNGTLTTFRGFTSVGAINSVTVAALRPNSEPIFATVNNFRLGAAPTVVIPEPSTYALVATGLVALVAVSRRRRMI